MSNDTSRSGQDASGRTEHPEDAVFDVLRHILSQSEAARSALATTLREGGTPVGTIAGVRSEDVVVEGERPGLAGLDEEGVVRVLVQPVLWAGLSQGQPNAYFKGLPLDRPAALLFVAPAARLAALWPELCRRADEQFYDHRRDDAGGFARGDGFGRGAAADVDELGCAVGVYGEGGEWGGRWRRRGLC